MKLLIITPVKNSIETFQMTVRSIFESKIDVDWDYVVYDDYSTPENAEKLDVLSKEFGFKLIHLSQEIDTPSPNYNYVLQQSQCLALGENAHLIIVESDVTVGSDTIMKLANLVRDDVGMIAAVTTDEYGKINFPYLYSAKYAKEVIKTKKRLSFCCTLLSNNLLTKYDFMGLDAKKSWYDVTISHRSIALGLCNILDMNNQVIHRAHSSRPWKKLKYNNLLKYYWLKFTQGLDKI